MKSIGEPLALALNAMKSTSTPYGFSPLATAVSTAPLPRTATASAAFSFSKNAQPRSLRAVIVPSMMAAAPE